MIGKTIVHYTILEKLGEGGMGVVYKAHDTKLDRDVALKFLPAHLSASGEDRTRFLQEARAAAALSHPNICTIFAIEEFREEGSSAPQFFFAMELVEGKTMRQAMTEVTLQGALDVGSQVAGGLAAAHDKGIVHRDIKAENIMLRPDGRVQIMDFGLAKVKGGSPLTRAGSTVGTIGYMSPEQIQGLDVDHRADIFSLGVLLYEMAAGKLPFSGVHDAAIMYEIVNVRPANPSDVRPDVPAELGRIVMKCLAKDREERYQSVRDVAVDLKLLRKQSGSGVTAIPPAAGPPPGSATVPPRGPSATAAAPGERKKRKPAVIAAAGFFIIVCAAILWFSMRGGPSGMISSMIVLPFENVGSNPDLEYLSDGVTEGIINRVTGIPDLRVVPRSASFRYKGSSEDPRTIGDQLGVDAVLTGRVVQRGDRLDLTLELIDVQAFAQLWGESYQRTMGDLMSVQEEIVSAVTGKIRPGSARETSRAGKRETENPAAYRLYLQGKFHWNRRTATDLDRALEYFNQAIAIDPGFARAHLGLAESYLLKWEYSSEYSTEIRDLAEREAKKAIELDSTLGEAHAALGMVRKDLWDWDGAEREFKLAIEKAPAYPTNYHWYRIFLSSMGRDDEALAVIKKGVELDPYSPIILSNLAAEYVSRNDVVSAEEVLQSIFAIDPDFFWANIWQARIDLDRGRIPDARRRLDGMKIEKYSTGHLGFMGYYYARLGDTSKADSLFRVVRNSTGSRRGDPVAAAAIRAGFGDTTGTIALLREALNEDPPSWSLSTTRTFPEMRLIHDDPRYHEILKKMGMK